MKTADYNKNRCEIKNKSMVHLTQLSEKENGDDNTNDICSSERIILASNHQKGEDKNTEEELFGNDTYVWNLLLLIDKKNI